MRREAASYCIPPEFKGTGDFTFLYRSRFTSQILCASSKSLLNESNACSPLLSQLEWKKGKCCESFQEGIFQTGIAVWPKQKK